MFVRRNTYILFFVLINFFFCFGCSLFQGNIKKIDLQKKVHIIKHALGTTTVSLKPKRVIVLDSGGLDNLLALGVKPIAAPTRMKRDPFFPYLQNQTKGIKKIGTINQPNIEIIAKQKPDLILGVKEINQREYEKLSRIAPTIFVNELQNWKENLQLQALAVGKSKEARKLIKHFDTRIKKLKVKIHSLNEHPISLLRPQLDHIRVYLRHSFSGKFIEEIGLVRPKRQRKNAFDLKVTEENIQVLDGDIIIWFSHSKENLLKDKIMKNPLWAKLKAVKKKQVYQVSAQTWLNGMGIQAAHLMLDDITKILLKN